MSGVNYQYHYEVGDKPIVDESWEFIKIYVRHNNPPIWVYRKVAGADQ